METKLEAVTTVYKNGSLIALIKREEGTRKHLIYTVKEAKTEDIVRIITSNLNEA